jgi:hypothetical protein
MRETLRRNKAVVLEALAMEVAPGARKAEEKARQLLAQGSEPWAAAAETEGEWTFVACLRRDGSGWTVPIPKDEFDPFRLAEALMRVDPRDSVH